MNDNNTFFSNYFDQGSETIEMQLFSILYYLVGLLYLLNLHHWDRLRTVHDLLDGHFIPEVAIHSQVENIFKCRGSMRLQSPLEGIIIAIKITIFKN